MTKWDNDKGVYTITPVQTKSRDDLRQDLKKLESRIEAEKKRRGL